jgi:hypothetical protein
MCMNNAAILPVITVVSPPSIHCTDRKNSILIVGDTVNSQKIVDCFNTYWPDRELVLYIVDQFDEETLHWIRLHETYCPAKIVAIDKNIPFTCYFGSLWAMNRNTWLYMNRYIDEFGLFLTQHSENCFDNPNTLVQHLIDNFKIEDYK